MKTFSQLVKLAKKYKTTTIILSLSTISILAASSAGGTDYFYVRKHMPKYGTMPSNPHVSPIISLYIKGQFSCSGFIIDANYAITASHCLLDDKGDKQVGVSIKGVNESRAIPVKVAGIYARTDLGLITGDFNNFIPLNVDFNSAPFFDAYKVYAACGHPLGQQVITCTPFKFKRSDEGQIGGLGFLVPGMSGGPLLDPQTGVVIGINTRFDNGSPEGIVAAASTIGLLGVFGIEPELK